MWRCELTCSLLQELLAAPEEHWLHEYHDADGFKKPDNPLMVILLTLSCLGFDATGY